MAFAAWPAAHVNRLLPTGEYRAALQHRADHHDRRGGAARGRPRDNLTEAGTVLGAWTFPGGDECDLVAAPSHLPVPIEGFGSTTAGSAGAICCTPMAFRAPWTVAAWSETRCCLIFGSEAAAGEELRCRLPQDPRRSA